MFRKGLANKPQPKLRSVKKQNSAFNPRLPLSLIHWAEPKIKPFSTSFQQTAAGLCEKSSLTTPLTHTDVLSSCPGSHGRAQDQSGSRPAKGKAGKARLGLRSLPAFVDWATRSESGHLQGSSSCCQVFSKTYDLGRGLIFLKDQYKGLGVDVVGIQRPWGLEICKPPPPPIKGHPRGLLREEDKAWNDLLSLSPVGKGFLIPLELNQS